MVVRFVPKAVDYVIGFLQFAILAAYCYVAYFYDSLDSPECKGDSESIVPLLSDSSIQGVNVTEHFKIAIRMGFWITLLTFTRAVLAQIGLFLRRWMLLWCSYVLFAANISMSIVLFILMQIWRWSHSGRVCSGDLLPDSEDCDPNIYLCFEGRFIKGMLITIYSIAGLSMCSIGVVTICVFKKQSAEEKKAIEAAGGDVSEINRVSAFTKALDPDYEAAMRDTRTSIMKKKNNTTSPGGAQEQLLKP